MNIINEELNKIYNEDCLEFMKKLPDNCLDSIVTDPPYGLSSIPDISGVMECWIKGEQYKHNGKGFMGKEWDSFVPGPEYWKEAYRILKPGGYLAAFAGSRTQDLMSIAIRFGGFEIRDTLFWLYQSGFPKSSNVSLHIDKKLGYEPKIIGMKQSGIGSGDSFAMKQTEGSNSEVEPTAPIYEFQSEEAKRWEGWGTALKPAYEPIILARKPNEKGLSNAENILKWGTGALNIKDNRVPHNGDNLSRNSINKDYSTSRHEGYDRPWKNDPELLEKAKIRSIKNQNDSENFGRWPSNILIDESDQIEEKFAEFGESKSSKKSGTPSSGQNGMFLSDGGGFQTQAYGDSGTMTKMLHKFDYDEEDSELLFYIHGKATIADRDEGLDNFNEQQKAGEYCISSHNGENRLEKSNKRKNIHPTVKPTKLMSWLCKLVTPPNGLIYDPFSGSGSTGKGAVIEGFNFIGTEMEKEYSEIANGRLNYAIKFKSILKQAGKPLIKNNKTNKGNNLINNNFF